MGSIPSFPIHEVSEIRSSKIDPDGKGAFATQDLSPGTILHNHKDANDEQKLMGGYMNDADFKLNNTDNLSLDLIDAFNVLDAHSTNGTTSNNVEQFCEGSQTYYKVIKPIKKGDELTKTYGLSKWFVLLSVKDTKNLELYQRIAKLYNRTLKMERTKV